MAANALPSLGRKFSKNAKNNLDSFSFDWRSYNKMIQQIQLFENSICFTAKNLSIRGKFNAVW